MSSNYHDPSISPKNKEDLYLLELKGAAAKVCRSHGFRYMSEMTFDPTPGSPKVMFVAYMPDDRPKEWTIGLTFKGAEIREWTPEAVEDSVEVLFMRADSLGGDSLKEFERPERLTEWLNVLKASRIQIVGDR